MPPTPRKRVRMDYDARRHLILQAARDLFLERPYSLVSLAAIAERAGVAKGLLHHYFDSKRDLYLAVVRDVARVPDGAGAGVDATGPDVWERSVDGLLGLIAANPAAWLGMVSVSAAERDGDVASIVDESKEVLADQTLRALGVDPDAAAPEERALVRAYGGLVQEVTLEWLERGRLDREQVRMVLLHVMPLLLERVLPLVRAGEAPATARRTGARGAPRAGAGGGR